MGKKADNRFPLRLDDVTRWRIERWYKMADCQSRNEFVEKAVNFYASAQGKENRYGPQSG